MGRTSEAVAEGVSIACAAARMAVRNHILIETIAHGNPFLVDEISAFARETLEMLAVEQEAEAERLQRQRKRAWGQFTDSDGTHDYRDRDIGNLRRRYNQCMRVAERLREIAADPEATAALVEVSRDAAWGDVEANLQRRLKVEGMTEDADPDYARMRDARMDALQRVDLPLLAAQSKRRRPGRLARNRARSETT